MNKMWRYTLLTLLCVFQINVIAMPAGGPLQIKFPQSVNPNNDQDIYTKRLLEEAIKIMGHPYSINISKSVMVQSRSMSEVIKPNGEINIFWTMTSPDREQALQAVRIPLFKGLYGWRLVLVNVEHRNIFSDVKELRDLQYLTFVQGHDWPDAKIFSANNLKITTSSNFEGLFQMVKKNRAVGLPRSIIEVWWELEQHKTTLDIEQNISLHYPTAMYFFTGKDNVELALLVEEGLNRLIANGQFDSLFYAYNGQHICKARLDTRKIIELKNPLLPKDTPLTRSELWFQEKDIDRACNAPAPGLQQ